MDNRTIDEIRDNETKLIRDIFKLEKELESKRKEYQETYKDVRIELKEKDKEIDRYKNIIDELAIWLINQSKDYKGITKYDKCLQKLNELEDEK